MIAERLDMIAVSEISEHVARLPETRKKTSAAGTAAAFAAPSINEFFETVKRHRQKRLTADPQSHVQQQDEER